MSQVYGRRCDGHLALRFSAHIVKHSNDMIALECIGFLSPCRFHSCTLILIQTQPATATAEQAKETWNDPPARAYAAVHLPASIEIFCTPSVRREKTNETLVNCASSKIVSTSLLSRSALSEPLDCFFTRLGETVIHCAVFNGNDITVSHLGGPE